MLFAIWLIVGAGFGLACGLLAVRRNRSATTWYALGLLTGPVALAVLSLRPRRDHPSFL